MSTPFITEHFLLHCDAAERLYHEFAASLPIIDYHCHLPPKDIAEDRRFANLAQIWIEGDHYKWRAMRAAGVDEQFITGKASDWEKFEKWAETAPKTLRNPLYHWTHLELRRPFGIADRLFNPETAKSIWNDANAKLQQPDFTARGIMRQMNVQVVCTTDDPIDLLDGHRQIAADAAFPIRVLPTFRPDKAMLMTALLPETDSVKETVTQASVTRYNAYLDKLAQVSGVAINTFEDLIAALENRHNYFHEQGCRLSDHGFERFSFTARNNNSELLSTFHRLRNGEVITEQKVVQLQSAIMYEIARMDSKRDWTMQLHIGAIRNNNTRFYQKIGIDAGFDSMADGFYARPLSRFLDRLDQDESLPKTIVYNLNPKDNEMLVTMMGNFQDGLTAGKMQFGSGWWFLDQKNGMETQINALSSLGLLSRFVGMLTDSRSFLSYTRHEYFRRILCNMLGREMEAGELPNDFDLIGGMVSDICYNNANEYFGFNT